MSLKKIKIKKYWVIDVEVPADQVRSSWTYSPKKEVYIQETYPLKITIKAKSAKKAVEKYYEQNNYFALKHNSIVVKVEQLEPIVKLKDGKEEENEETRN